MKKADIRAASSDDLHLRIAEINQQIRRYIPFGRIVLDTERDKDPDLLQEMIWIQNELTKRETSHD